LRVLRFMAATAFLAAHSCSRKRIEQLHAGNAEIRLVARGDRQAMNQGGDDDEAYH